MHQAVDVVLQSDKCAEAGKLGYFTLYEITDLVQFVDLVPRIIVELLDADGDALVFAIDLEHLRLDVHSFFQHLGRVVDFARPGYVGDVDHSVKPFLEPHEGTVACEVANFAGHLGADFVFLLGQIPRVGLELANAQ